MKYVILIKSKVKKMRIKERVDKNLETFEPQPGKIIGKPDKEDKIAHIFTETFIIEKAGVKGMKWSKHKPSDSDPHSHVLKTEDGIYEITSVKGGHHLTFETGGGHLPWGWTKPGTFASLGIHSSVEAAQEEAQKHQATLRKGFRLAKY